MRFIIRNLVLPRFSRITQQASDQTTNGFLQTTVHHHKKWESQQCGSSPKGDTGDPGWAHRSKANAGKGLRLQFESHQTGKKFPALGTNFFSFFFFLFFQIVSWIGWSPPRWGGLSAELSLWIKMLISSKGTLTSTHNHAWTVFRNFIAQPI